MYVEEQFHVSYSTNGIVHVQHGMKLLSIECTLLMKCISATYTCTCIAYLCVNVVTYSMYAV